MTLRIQKSAGREELVLTLSGELDAELLEELHNAIAAAAAERLIILDMKEVQLVDAEAVKFLGRCEERGIVLASCPAYVREWVLRERQQKQLAFLSK